MCQKKDIFFQFLHVLSRFILGQRYIFYLKVQRKTRKKFGETK